VLDHLFIMVQPGAPERAALEEAAVAAVDTLLREGCTGAAIRARAVCRFIVVTAGG